MSDVTSYPKFKAKAGLQRGKALSKEQRTHSRFDPEPTLFGKRLRPSGTPVEFSEKQFEAQEHIILTLMRSGSIIVETQGTRHDPWRVLPVPTPGQWAKYRADKANKKNVEGDGKLSEETKQMLEQGAAFGAESIREEVDTKILKDMESKIGGHKADTVIVDGVAVLDSMKAKAPEDLELEELDKATTPTPTPVKHSDEKHGGKKKGKG